MFELLKVFFSSISKLIFCIDSLILSVLSKTLVAFIICLNKTPAALIPTYFNKPSYEQLYSYDILKYFS